MQWSPDKYIRTLQFAARAHQGQIVPGTELPYVIHLNLVSMEVIADFRQNDTACDQDLAVQCALLHDVIEDTTITFEEVMDNFGSAVAEGVQALSKNKTLDSKMQMSDSLRRIREQPEEVWMVKLADRITNLQPPPHYWTHEKKKLYKAEAIEILEALRDCSQSLAARLLSKINAYPA